jgi:hypothetical protein
MPKPLKGVGYELNSTNKGFSLSIDEPPYVEPGDGFGIIVTPPEFPFPTIPYLPLPQFQCFATPGTGSNAGNTMLSIVAGGVNYTNSNMPYIAEGIEQNFAQAFILKAAVLSTGVVAVPGTIPTTSLAPMMLNNGFYKLQNPANKYYVVLSYYDADGDPSALDVPIIAERRPWISILEEGCSEFDKIFIEQGPSYYTGLLNIAPMTEYDDAGDPKKYFGFNHTGYFNPTKFGANIKIIAMIENGLVTQYTNGGQNLTIPVHNHGTRLMYVPGMLEADDPYYANESDDWSYVVNTADIQGLAGVSYTGGWWNQVTDNTNPVAVTTHNYSYYSVNYTGTDNMGEFSCAVLGWPSGGGISHRLKIKSGLVTFNNFVVTNATSPTDNGGLITSHNLKHIRINKPNLYPEDTLHIGLDDNPDYIHSDGYIELTEGSDYYVFLFKVTPDWGTYDEAKAPQLCIAKVGDDPNTKIVMTENGGGVLQNYIWSQYVMGSDIFGNQVSPPGTNNWSPVDDPALGYVEITGDGTFPVIMDLGAVGEGVAPYPTEVDYSLEDKGFKETGCYRKDIALIKWNGDKFIVHQLHTGPIVFNDMPFEGNDKKIVNIADKHWERTDDAYKTNVEDILGASFSGYTYSLYTSSDTVLTGSTDTTKYLSKQPSQIENPDIT